MPPSMADKCLLLHAAGAPQDINNPYATVRFCSLMAFPMHNFLGPFPVHFHRHRNMLAPQTELTGLSRSAFKAQVELHKQSSEVMRDWSACVDLA